MPTSPIAISKGTLNHIINDHTIQSASRQLARTGWEIVESKFSKKTFFNPEWTADIIEGAVGQATKLAKEAGITSGQFTTQISGDTITIALKEGRITSAWGSYEWSEIRKILEAE